jgi:hypothetical protein
MGKALVAVGAFLVVCFLVFGGVVYFNRHENRIAVDSILAQEMGKAVVEADQEHTTFDLRDVTPFDWDRVVIYDVGTPRRQVSRALGFTFMGDLPYTAESSEVFVFTDNGRFVRFADYRGRGHFVGLHHPITVLAANDAVFRVHDGAIVLRR